MRVEGGSPAAWAPVSHVFIDEYMPAANGEYVKTYLMLLRLTGSREMSLSQMADRLDQTEKDVRRALRYWEKQGLIELTEEGGEITSLQLRTPLRRPGLAAAEPEESAPVPEADPEGARKAAPAAEEKTAAAPEESAAPPRTGYPAAKLKALKEEHIDFDQLLFAVEHYIGRPLTERDMDLFAWLYDALGFPGETLEYLTEYCVEKWDRENKKKDHHMMRYLEKVALEWHAAGAVTLAQAKQQAARFAQSNSAYTAVAKALGLKDRNLTTRQCETVSGWLYDRKLPLELILEACERTVMRINKSDLAYAEKILADWQAHGVTDLAALRAAEAERPKGEKKPARTADKNGQADGAPDYDETMRQIWLREYRKRQQENGTE